MGNSSTKEAGDGRARSSSLRQPGAGATSEGNPIPGDSSRHHPVATTRTRSSRHEAAASSDPALEPRKETRAEREARKAEKERQVRAKERERSLKEESIDGGYLVTLGVYVGPEDFSKAMVRQLQLERRLAPFWRGLDDHSDEWVEHQLVAAAKGLPIPAPDEPPQEEPLPPPQGTSPTQPIAFRHASLAEPSSKASPSTSFFSRGNTTSPSSAPSTGFRGRSITLASLTSKNNSQQDLTPQEVQLPHDPYVNGQRIEAFLYKDASECPICFLYYPPYLNKTRCCDQPICSECFVQIKRPDPHPPEHHGDPNEPAPAEPVDPANEGEYVSEPATCPFCKQPEFGVTYEPPTFRRGLAYANDPRAKTFVKQTSAMSSSMSLSPPSTGGRRRATSLSASDAQVITTDRIRPDWAKKLADARAHQARRAAAATALHNAAYLLGQNEGSSSRLFGRRRRQNLILVDGPNGSESATPHGEGTPVQLDVLMAALEQQGAARRADQAAGRTRSRGDDIEELMLMEAIRQSLATEEERKKKEEKAAAKEAKKEEKVKAKEQKKADKAAKKTGSSSPFYSMSPTSSHIPSSPVEEGKGKARAADASTDSAQLNAAGFVPLTEPSSTLNTEIASDSRNEAQRHLEQSRAILDSGNAHTAAYRYPRHMSDASSVASSFAESAPGSGPSFGPSPNHSGNHLPGGQGQDTSGSLGTEPMFNFGSLAGIMGKEEMAHGATSHHVEDIAPEVQSSSNALGLKNNGNNGNAIHGLGGADAVQAAAGSEYYRKKFGDVTVTDAAEHQTTQ